MDISIGEVIHTMLVGVTPFIFLFFFFFGGRHNHFLVITTEPLVTEHSKTHHKVVLKKNGLWCEGHLHINMEKPFSEKWSEKRGSLSRGQSSSLHYSIKNK